MLFVLLILLHFIPFHLCFFAPSYSVISIDGHFCRFSRTSARRRHGLKTTRIQGPKVYPTDILYYNPYQLQTSIRLLTSDESDFVFGYDKILIAIIALSIGIMAQTLIGSMLNGDQGLGAYLSDGSGYNKSAFRTKKKTEDGFAGSLSKTKDPLPWIKLPKFEYVEVVGQQQQDLIPTEQQVLEKLNKLQGRMRMELESGDQQKANVTRKELQSLMEEYGFEYQPSK